MERNREGRGAGDGRRLEMIVFLSVLFAAVMICSMAMISNAPVLMFLIAAVCIVLAAFEWQPCVGLYIVLLVCPVISTSFFEIQLLGVPGFKISVLLPLLSFLYLFFVGKGRKLFPAEGRLLFLYFILFTVAIFRSYGYLAERNIQLGEEFSWVRHIMTNYLRPLLTFLTLYFVAAYVTDLSQLKRIVSLLMTSMVIAFFVTIYAASTSENFSDFDVIRETIGYFVGTHSGYFANFFLVLYPMTLLLAVKGYGKKYYIIGFLEILCIGLTFSRASYLVIILITIGVLVIEKRWKQILGLISCIPIIIAMIPSIVIKRMMTGIADNNANELSAGRLDSIWGPILQELSVNFRMLVIGNGRYGVYDTIVSKSGAAMAVNNAHNILLDMICDSGIVGLVFFITFFIYFILHFYAEYKKTSDEYIRIILLGIMLGILSFLTKGMTDGVFWAEVGSNAMVYVLIGLGVASIHISRNSRMENTNEEM